MWCDATGRDGMRCDVMWWMDLDSLCAHTHTYVHTYIGKIHAYMHAPMYTYTHIQTVRTDTRTYECCTLLYRWSFLMSKSARLRSDIPKHPCDDECPATFSIDKPCQVKQTMGFPPNFVHSMDVARQLFFSSEPLDVISLDVCFVGNQTVQVCRVFIIWSDQNGIIRIVEWSGLGEMSSYRIEQIRLVCCTQFP